MSIEILGVTPNAVAVAWKTALPLLEKPISMSQGCYLPEDVAAACQMGEMQLWLAADGEEVVAAYVTEVTTYPRKRVVRAVFAGGKPHTIQHWLDPMVDGIETWARAIGCVAITAMGRKGWARVVEGEEVATVLWRDFPAMEMH